MDTSDNEGSISPRPEETGSEGEQDQQEIRPGTALTRPDEQSLYGSHFGKVIEAVPEIRGPVAMQFAAAGVRQLASDLEALREQLRAIERDRDSWREKYYEERTQRTVLHSQAKDRPRIQQIQNVALAVGGLIGGAGIQLAMQSGTTVVGSLLSVAGAVLLWMGASRVRERD